MTLSREKWVTSLALKYFVGCEKILDVGCGDGNFVVKDSKRIVGLDHNKESLEKCKARGLKVFFGEAPKLPFGDNSFDGVLCSHLIEHLQPLDAYKLLVEVDRVLKVGGVFVLATPLLHRDFYCDLTHVKPYYPKAILHYLTEKKWANRTFGHVKGRYKVLCLEYEKGNLFRVFLTSFSLWGVGGWFGRRGYVLVLKKVD